jgi:hypothetical protein
VVIIADPITVYKTRKLEVKRHNRYSGNRAATGAKTECLDNVLEVGPKTYAFTIHLRANYEAR